MKTLSFRFLVSAVFLAFIPGMTGCAPTVIVNGQTYEALTPKEERTLILVARQALLNKKKILTPDEVRLIRDTEPAFEIRYSGDRIGNATVTWTGQKRIITFKFWGKFLEPGYMASFMSIEDRQPPTLDLRKTKKKK